MGIFVEDFDEEKAAIQHLVKVSGRLWIYYLVYIVLALFCLRDEVAGFQFLAVIILFCLGTIHFDVMQSRIETRQAWLSQWRNSSEMRAFVERRTNSI
ncbi:MAG: hypothetical protein HRU33_09560 [Rhodobacteraceae bacterium]|nr:hypothetical protein [Paracoccaceae bacterium]